MHKTRAMLSPLAPPWIRVWVRLPDILRVLARFRPDSLALLGVRPQNAMAEAVVSLLPALPIRHENAHFSFFDPLVAFFVKRIYLFRFIERTVKRQQKRPSCHCHCYCYCNDNDNGSCFRQSKHGRPFPVEEIWI
jgi:hypothetical protein